MLTFLHFMVGTLALLFHEKKNLKYFLIAGFLGIAADFDLIFNWLNIDFWWLTHRGIFHSFFASISFGIAALIIYRNFWLGFLPHLFHVLLDLIDPIGGPIMIFPDIWFHYPLPINRAIISGVIGSLILLFWMIYGYKSNQE